ncbi:MAG TPA: hypothetical protein VHN77_00740 [Phycisphaerales bacterium]|nr:hypothetical protein [Phycisphaerales bacterium]
MHLRPTITDDAGTPVPLVRFNLTYLPAPTGPLPRQVQKAMRDECERLGTRRGGWATWAVAICVFVLPAVLTFVPFWVSLLARRRWLESIWMYVWTLAMVPVAWACTWVLGPHALTPPQRARAAKVAVRAGFCGSCGYPLAPTPQATCSECGARWNTAGPDELPPKA